MSKLRPQQQHPPAKKLTPDELRKNPWLVAIIRGRIKEIKALQRAKQADKAGSSEEQRELDFD